MMPNNAFLRLIFPPDLNITNLTAPDSIVIGMEYPINVTIRNDGRSDAHDFNVTLCIDGKQMVRIPHLDLPTGDSTTLHLYNWTPIMLDHVYNLTVTADILSGEDWTEVEVDNNGMIVDAGAPGVGDLNGDNQITPADAVIAL
jgi:subtilase family serine protease